MVKEMRALKFKIILISKFAQKLLHELFFMSGWITM